MLSLQTGSRRRLSEFNHRPVMKRLLSFMSAALVAAIFSASSARALNLLTNPGFEQPPMSTPGNNFPATLPGWTLTAATAPCENGHNIVLAGVDPYAGGPDRAVEGLQYYDICGAAGYLSQSFTLTYASDVS